MRGFLKRYNNYIDSRKVTVDILAVLFGLGSWIGINGMFVQLPLLVKVAPEQWSLPSYMSIAVQIANIGPISYALYRKFFTKHLNDTYWIVSLLFMNVISALLMSFFYDHISYIGDKPHSVFFLCLVFVTSIVGCTSSVLFFPYMRHFKEIYLISYFIGEGLSGFVPSILALIQGIGGNPECVEIVNPDGNVTMTPITKDPLYSTDVFFIIISCVSLCSFVSYLLLVNLTVCKRERVSLSLNNVQQMKNMDPGKPSDSITSSDIILESSELRSISLLILMGFVCAFGNGVFPSIQSYSCLPYGNLAYHLSVTLGSMANPAACFLAIFLPRTSSRSITMLTSVCAVFVVYVLTTSVLSPSPPLVGEVEGVVIVVLAWIIVIGLVSYIKLCISTIFRSKGGNWMFYCGACSQLGSAIGSLISFCLINFTSIFVQAEYCK